MPSLSYQTWKYLNISTLGIKIHTVSPGSIVLAVIPECWRPLMAGREGEDKGEGEEVFGDIFKTHPYFCRQGISQRHSHYYKACKQLYVEFTMTENP